MYQLTNTFSNIEGYIAFTKSLPILTREEEIDLATRLKKGDLDAAKDLIYAHLRMVVKIAREHSWYGVPFEDLIQEGNIGLMKAVKAFDLSRGVRLCSFAPLWIKHEIQQYILNNWRLVKIATTKAHTKLFYNLKKLKKTLGTLGVNETEEMAKQLDLKPSDVTEFETRLAGTEMTIYAENDEETAPINWLQDTHNEPLNTVERTQKQWFMTEGIKQALGQLDKRSAEIVQARWLDDETKTLHELAPVYNVSPERIRQIEVEAFKKLKVILKEIE